MITRPSRSPRRGRSSSTRRRARPGCARSCTSARRTPSTTWWRTSRASGAYFRYDIRMTFLAAQRAVVRMLFDPAFAAAVREAPDVVLAGVEPALRAQLAALDDRALRLDR